MLTKCKALINKESILKIIDRTNTAAMLIIVVCPNGSRADVAHFYVITIWYSSSTATTFAFNTALAAHSVPTARNTINIPFFLPTCRAERDEYNARLTPDNS